jgi:hypothetical protein
MLGTSVRCGAFWSLGGGHPASGLRGLQRRLSGSVPSTMGVGSMRNSDVVRARVDILVALVITYRIKLRQHAAWSRCGRGDRGSHRMPGKLVFGR